MKMRIIPAMDIINGKCVRLLNGDYQKMTVYREDPLEMAKKMEAHGLQFLHLVDLEGAKSDRVINYKVLEKIAAKTALKIDFGGGIKSDDDLHIAFNSGANQVTAGSIAVKNPEVFVRWLKQYGRAKIILGADLRNGKIAVSGWQEESDQSIVSFLEDYSKKGIEYVTCTDISKDGTLSEPSVDLYSPLIPAFPDIKLIASGGIATLESLYRLDEIGCEAAIIGKALYENRISLQELEQLILRQC